MKHLVDAVEAMTQHALAMADGAAINYRKRDQEEESSRSFEINVKGKPMTVTVVVSSIEER